MSFVGDTTSLPVTFDGTRLHHAGQPLAATFGAERPGPARLYVRPRDVALGEPEASRLSGVIVNIHRTAEGRRAQVSLGAAANVIEVEIDSAAEVACGECVGLTFTKGRVFPG
jgi:sulfate/thiosulfate transport system ATP-binding protein